MPQLPWHYWAAAGCSALIVVAVFVAYAPEFRVPEWLQTKRRAA